MKDKNKENALEWIKNNFKEKDFESEVDKEDKNDSVDNVMKFYAFEMAQFHDALAPKTPMKQWIKRHYHKDSVDTFFKDHERQANRYYGC